MTLFAVVAPNRSTDEGRAAREYLRTMIFKKPIVLEVLSEESDNKVTALAYTEHGVNINENLLRNGWAFFDFYNVGLKKKIIVFIGKKLKSLVFMKPNRNIS